jgi:hypothetical protein
VLVGTLIEPGGDEDVAKRNVITCLMLTLALTATVLCGSLNSFTVFWMKSLQEMLAKSWNMDDRRIALG